MSSSAVVVPFQADPALVLIRAGGPVMYVGAPVAAGWAAWAERLDRALATSCQGLMQRRRQARRITVTLRYTDGRVRARSLILPKATQTAADFLPAALGLLRLLVDERPGVASKLSVQLGLLARVDNGRVHRPNPVTRRQVRGTKMRSPKLRTASQAGWIRAAAAMALVAGGARVFLPLS